MLVVMNFVDFSWLIFLITVLLIIKSTFVALSKLKICRYVFLVALCDSFSHRNTSWILRDASGQRDVGKVFIVDVIKVR